MAGGLKTVYQEQGYVAPVRLFSRDECRAILSRLERNHALPPLDWNKGWAATSPDYYALGAHDAILELVRALLGHDVILWGASLVVRGPGQVHPWHTDIESSAPDGKNLSVWIGLENTDARSSLKVVPYSHRFGITLQQVIQQHSKIRESVTDEDVSQWAKEREPRSGVVPLSTFDGEAILFDGRLWHGSHNTTEDRTRRAVLLQYAAPGTPIRIPNSLHLNWPFEIHESPKPPCILLSGHAANGANRIVPPPVARDENSLPALSSRVHALKLPLGRDPKTGWKPHPLFRGSTPDIRWMNCHVSVLEPGRQPHPPHRHEEEEILIVLDGEADLWLEDGRAKEGVAPHRAHRGTFTFYPSHFAHTIQNNSSEPVTYLMFKWKNDRQTKGEFLRDQFLSCAEARPGMQGPGATGFVAGRLLDGETECLRHLHAHVTTVQPGAGYDPHVDPYDVGIVVLEGRIETLGERVGPNGLIYYAAGEPHGLRNVGDTPARYVVFEFHGRHCKEPSQFDERLTRYDRRFSRRLVGCLRDPERFKRALKRRARWVIDAARGQK